MDNNLPPEVLERLFIHVSNPYDLFTLRLVCRQWHAVITNERFLNLYFRRRLGSHTGQRLKWLNLQWVWTHPSRQHHQKCSSIPANLQGSGGIIIDSFGPGHRAPLLSAICPLTDYSIGMWLRPLTCFKSIIFSMQSNDFSLEFIMNRRYIETHCSHMNGLGARTNIDVSFRRWIYIVLTKESSSPSTFIFWINGRKYSLVPIQGPLSKDDTGTNLVHDDFDSYLQLRYEDNITNIKFFSTIDIADVQVLPCSMTRHEIHAIIEQSTSIDKLDMGKYTLERWANLRWYSGYSFRECILL